MDGSFNQYLKEKGRLMIVVVIFMIAAAGIYFVYGQKEIMQGSGAENKYANDANDILKDIRMKAAYTPQGAIKVFALAQNNDLKDIKASQGNNIPEYDSIVIGSDEAKMMQEERLFASPGDGLSDLFGIDTRVEGILSKTGTMIDDFHFVSSGQYEKLDGDQDVLSIQFKDDVPKLFYIYDKDRSQLNITLSDGNMNLFYKHVSRGKVYYPLILGSKEAEMMKDEGLFTKVGDTIDGFFGKDVIIVGIVQETGTALDMMHMVEKDFFEKKLVTTNGVLL